MDIIWRIAKNYGVKKEAVVMKDISNLKKDKSISKRRRNFAKAGIVAPVFLTLLNRPAWGATRSMCTVSGFDSGIIQGGIVSGVDVNEVCSGVHPEMYWADNAILDVNGIDVRDSSFNTVFNTSFAAKDSTSLLDMINSTFERERRFVGLYLDALSGLEGFPLGSTADVVSIYNGDLTFFQDHSWSQENVDDFINYLLTHQ